MKKHEAADSLTNEQQQLINEGALILVGTIDHENQAPAIAAISWVKVQPDGKRIRFSVTSSSRICSNLEAHPNAVLCFIGLGSVYSIAGSVSVLAEKLEGVAMPLAKLELEVSAVYPSLFWGAAITQDPAYEKTYDKARAQALDEQVYAALLQ